MTLRIDLTGELEAILTAKARQQGLPVDSIATHLLSDALASQEKQDCNEPGRPALLTQLTELALRSSDTELREAIEFLRAKEDAQTWPVNSTALASERSLAREWLSPEEDAAWSHS